MFRGHLTVVEERRKDLRETTRKERKTRRWCGMRSVAPNPGFNQYTREHGRPHLSWVFVSLMPLCQCHVFQTEPSLPPHLSWALPLLLGWRSTHTGGWLAGWLAGSLAGWDRSLPLHTWAHCIESLSSNWSVHPSKALPSVFFFFLFLFSGNKSNSF